MDSNSSMPSTQIKSNETTLSFVTEIILTGLQNIPTLEEIELTKFLRKNIPVTVYLVVLCIVGTIGNAHAFLVYMLRYRPSNHRTFVIWLAAVDFIACSFSIPFEIIDTRYNYTFYSVGACKFFRSLNHFVGTCSGLLLGVIAVERFMKACRPLGRQLSGKEATIACFVTVALCIVLAIPSTFLYGPNEKIAMEKPLLIGSDCTVLKQYKGSIFLRGYIFILLFLCTAVFVLCLVTYTFVGRVLYRQLKFRRSSQTLKPKQRLTSLSSCREVIPSSSDGGNGNIVKRESNPNNADDESSVGENGFRGRYPSSPSSPTSGSFRLKFSLSFKKKRIFDRSKQITLMFLVATAVSYAGYLPHLILISIQGISKVTYAQISIALGPLNSILLRGYFLNNATNPLVYCFMDDRFRKECKHLYRKFKVMFLRIFKR